MLENEKHYLRLMSFLVGLYGTAVFLFATFLKPTSKDLGIVLLYGIGVFGIPSIMWLVGQGKVFLFCVRLIDWRRGRTAVPDNIEGIWDILIEFKEDESDELHRRHGHLKIERKTLGYSIAGSSLYDIDDRETMARWKGTRVVFIRRDDAHLLVYVYETYEGKADSEPSKFGIVVAGRKKGSVEFLGAFHDYLITDQGSSFRTGTVRLVPESALMR